MKDIDEVLPRLVVLEQTLITFGYREIQVFEREVGVGLIHELPRWRHLGDIFPRRLAVDASVSCWLLGHVDYFGFAAISLKKMYPDTLFA
jgi:hypothetical protein